MASYNNAGLSGEVINTMNAHGQWSGGAYRAAVSPSLRCYWQPNVTPT